MNMKILLLLIVISVVLVQFADSAYRGRGGGRSRGGGFRRSSSTRTSRSRTRRSFSPPGSSRVYKNTPIPVYTSKSPVIIPQTKLGSRSNLGRNVFFGYMFYRYGLMGAPVYRRRYPIHRSTVEIPDERAIRVNFTKEIMLDSNGTICLNSTKNYTIAPDKNERVRLKQEFIVSVTLKNSTEFYSNNRYRD
ncbi:uncharacterized protein LOC116308552 [Actinia tenebrosa]|uniref:Uncharacterized protein LOC116308552 n=1 Tax=Actinia tenebrosa TaxID=6105 RepID=A0A6P8J4B1_ACTTE|nr:uncharacterized protein LOC116308552 [Actinia tenebrosa]